MPLEKSWTPSVIQFTLAGIALVFIVGAIIYWLKTRDNTDYESKREVRGEPTEKEIFRKDLIDKISRFTNMVWALVESVNNEALDKKTFENILKRSMEHKKELEQSGTYSWNKWMAWLGEILDGYKAGILSIVKGNNDAGNLLKEIRLIQLGMENEKKANSIDDYLDSLFNMATARLAREYGRPIEPIINVDNQDTIAKWFAKLLDPMERRRSYEEFKKWCDKELKGKAIKLNQALRK